MILDELRRRKLANKRHLHVDHIETVESTPELRLTMSNLLVSKQSKPMRSGRALKLLLSVRIGLW